MSDFLFRGSLADLDPDIAKLNTYEAERQFRRLILIPSESQAPLAVREALDSAFHNIYAEGYPPEGTRWMSQEEILDYDARLGAYRRFGDPRYYKGVEYADVVEALARRRAAEAFAANGLSANELFVNVQALSGGPANNAVYHALVEPGSTVMGMNLIHGGHLSHGSPVNRSGKYFNIVSYTVDPETEQIDYEEMLAMAKEHQPKMLIGGFSSYPWKADWRKYRAIADEVGAYLLADISHVAGLIVGGVYPSPVGYADVITTTTHKTLCGPRGAMIMTHNAALAKKLDRAVFPGEQGGPHVNVFAAIAVAMKLARTDQFAALQKQIVDNCAAFTNRFIERGLTVAFGGSDTHLMNLDCSSITGPNGSKLTGDYAARILDVAGIVVNRNTIPGDRSALNPSGIRMGTPWITQRGFREAESIQLADTISDLFKGIKPYRISGKKRGNLRAKVDFGVLSETRAQVAVLAESAGIDFEPSNTGYPHFTHREAVPDDILEWAILQISGDKAAQFVNYVLAADVEAIQEGESRKTKIYTPGALFEGIIARGKNNDFNLRIAAKDANQVGLWLRDLSDGYVVFESEDLEQKLPGPVSIKNAGHGIGNSAKVPEPPLRSLTAGQQKPYFVGIESESANRETALQPFSWQGSGGPLRMTPLHPVHVDLGAKMVPFAGWEMPVWYSSVKEEHQAVRTAAGLFDVAHMGVYQAEGREATAFLNSVCANDISALKVGQSLYTHFLDPDANVIDDLLVYRRSPDHYLLVVNASNDAKDWAWLNAVREGTVLVDQERPWSRAYGRNVNLRDLRDPIHGSEMLVDVALQGPRSRDILLALESDLDTKKALQKLKRTDLAELTLEGMNLIVSRTGYTGEKMAFELFVHPDQLINLWHVLMEAGGPLGLKPTGLGARDSLRTEAGLPLYGQEMGGELNLGVGDSGFGSYVKVYKPWFIGRSAFIEAERTRPGQVVRFTFDEPRVRMAHLGDPVVDRRGRTIGAVTSCAVDSKGMLTGQAFLTDKHTKPGTAIFIFQSASKKVDIAPADLKPGDRTSIPSSATVVRRFPRL
jgi:glycine hydroxymethyltransferase